MTIYKSYEELKRNILERGDVLEFKKSGKILQYNVQWVFFESLGRHDNSEILFMLGFTTPTKRNDFCTKHYGYITLRGDWPEYKHNDMGAATRIALVVFSLLEGINFSWKNKYGVKE